MKCVVLDYSTSVVHVMNIPSDVEAKINLAKEGAAEDDAESIVEDWLGDSYNLSCINYMFGEDISLNFEI